MFRGVINTEVARGEAMKRAEPVSYERRKAEAYVVREGNPAPAVVPFTNEVARMAVNEKIHRPHGFRDPDGSVPHRVRKFHLGEDRRPAHDKRPACPVCASDYIWRRGDIDPFLGRIG